MLEVEYVMLYGEGNYKYMKDYDKNKESPYLKYWDINNLYGWAMLQKLSVGGLEWVEKTSQFDEDFIKRYKKENKKN